MPVRYQQSFMFKNMTFLRVIAIFYPLKLSFFSLFLMQCLSPTLFYFLLGPQREVISIYNDNFTTPCNRTPYFIEVYRCVKAAESECLTGPTYIVQANKTKIEIVVPDTGNKTKFYHYVIYNHTSCKCGREDERKEREPKIKDGREGNFTIG